MHCKNLAILEGQKTMHHKKNSKIFKREYLRCLSFYKETKKSGILFLPMWTFPAIFSKIGQKKWLSPFIG
jgi:hypothetical protein